MAGPIFNVLIGGFLSNLGWLVANPGKTIDFTAYDSDGKIANVAYLPIIMLGA